MYLKVLIKLITIKITHIINLQSISRDANCINIFLSFSFLKNVNYLKTANSIIKKLKNYN